MNLNLGCGNYKLDDFINVDKMSIYNPDILHDLEIFPWPFESDSVDHMVLSHVLEHLGQSPKIFIEVMKEIYRIAKHNSLIYVDVPCPKSKYYINDPTHVRPITPALFNIFNKKLNEHWMSLSSPNSLLAIENNINFEILEIELIVDKKIYDGAAHFNYQNYAHPLMDEVIILPKSDIDAYDELTKYDNNIVHNIHVLLQCNKD
jgi:predicted SAM-dependent methyltransferase